MMWCVCVSVVCVETQSLALNQKNICCRSFVVVIFFSIFSFSHAVSGAIAARLHVLLLFAMSSISFCSACV